MTSAALEECKEVNVSRIQGVEKGREASESHAESRTLGEQISTVVLQTLCRIRRNELAYSAHTHTHTEIFKLY